MKYIPYARQSINENDIKEVIEVLQSDWLTQGPALEKFERAVASFCGARYAVAVSNATSALHIACLAAGLGVKDRLWTSPNTFVASANCGLYCGAEVDFVDIDEYTYNMGTYELENKLKVAEEKQQLPKVVVPVDFAGQSCDMENIRRLADRYHFTVIEDASHAIGGTYKEAKIGSCAYSDMTIFSFHPVKIITTGEGGMVLTNRRDLFDKLIMLRSHGITRDADKMTHPADGPWYYEQLTLGFNYRMTEIQAALGGSQLQRINEFIDKRRYLVERYRQGLKDLPVTLPFERPECQSAWHLYVIRLQLDKIRKTHRQVFEKLRQKGVNVNLHYIPVHTQPYYQKMGFTWGDYPKAEQYYKEAISLPMFYELTEEQQGVVIKTVKEVLA